VVKDPMVMTIPSSCLPARITMLMFGVMVD
jgi:hypothetical protein